MAAVSVQMSTFARDKLEIRFAIKTTITRGGLPSKMKGSDRDTVHINIMKWSESEVASIHPSHTCNSWTEREYTPQQSLLPSQQPTF